MFSSEIRKLLIEVISSWQVLVITVVLVIYISIVNYVSKIYNDNPRMRFGRKPKKKKSEDHVASESEELGDNVLEDLDGEILGDTEAIDVLLHNPLDVVDTYDIFLLDENEFWYAKLGVKLTGNARIVFTDDHLLNDDL